MISAKISEIFSSLQGEGPYAGDKQIFVRFGDCNLQCGFCDESEKLAKEISIQEVLRQIKKLEKIEGPHTAISWTGGEPLLQVSFLKEIIPMTQGLNLKQYLETNGTLDAALNEVIGLIDIVAMDIKLPSVTHDRSVWDEHKAFLEVAKQKEVFVKLVVSGETEGDDFIKAVNTVGKADPSILLVLQPLTQGDVSELPRDIYKLQEQALEKLPNVRIIERLHKKLNIK